MSDYSEIEDYEVGYGRPPKSGQFKKGVSGNPLGRPKKAIDFETHVMRALDSNLTLNGNGRRKIIKKREGLAIQMVNKAVAGSLQAARLVIGWDQQALEKEAERQRRSPRNPALRVKDMTDEELMEMVTERAVRTEESTPDGGDGRMLSNPGMPGE